MTFPGSTTKDLESEEALAFQRRSWRIQRVGWCLMGAVLIFALLGGLGDGWLARTTVHSPDSSLSVRYDRVARMEATMGLEVVATPDGDGTVDLTFDRAFLDAVSLIDLDPPPLEVVSLPRGQRLRYAAESTAPVTLRFRVTPHRPGRLRTRIEGPGAGSVALSFLILP
jgi:hypothetical protein